MESVGRDLLVKVIKTVNSALRSIENYGNDYLINILNNHAEIQEESVNIQVKVATGAAKLAISGFEAFIAFIEINPSESEINLLNCIAAQESSILSIVDNATRTNGLCNNRLTANLTEALQETVAALLVTNAKLIQYTEELESCTLFDIPLPLYISCISTYGIKVSYLVKAEYAGGAGTTHDALEDVIAIFKIMFGQDVPRCSKEYFFPILAEGFGSSIGAATNCIFFQLIPNIFLL